MRVRTTSLAAGRQPGTFPENSDGKSYRKIWILKEGIQGPERERFPSTPPLRSRFSDKISFIKKITVEVF